MSPTALQLPIELEELRQILRDHGVVSAQLFGSYARGEQTETSDVDLLVEPAPGVSLFDLFDLGDELKARSGGIEFDIATDLNKHFAPYIEPELIDLGV